MRKEQPGKRTDPGKLYKERLKIDKSKDEFVAKENPKEPILSLAFRALKSKIAKNTRRARMRDAGYGNPPILEGAMVTGQGRPRDDA